MKRAAVYVRVSTREQTVENQRLELERVARARHWEVVAVYQDEGVSGAKGRDKRPAYDAMLKDAVRSRYDILMAWDVSRLGRSLTHLVQALEELHASGVDLYLHQQAIDTTTPSGKALFQMTAVFSEFERSMISERVRAGLRRAKAEGVRLGRPKVDCDLSRIKEARLHGKSLREIAAAEGLSLGKVSQILRAELSS